MADDKDFLKKVYDKYLNSDFEVGQSNLNPIREIEPVEILDSRTQEQKILDAIRARLEKIRDGNPLLKYGRPDTKKIDEFPSSMNSPGSGGGKIEVGPLFGPGGNMVIPSRTPGPSPLDPLRREIEEEILRLLPFVPTPTGGYGNDGGDSQGSKGFSSGKYKNEFGSLAVFQLNCANMDFESLMGEMPAGNDGLGNGNGNGGNGSGGGGDGDGNGGDGNGNGDEFGGNGMTAAEREAALKAARARGDKNACTLRELEFLKYIAIALDVVMMLKNTFMTLLSVIVFVSKTVSRLSTCWVAPPNAMEVCQLLFEKAIALAISIAGKLLAMFFSMLQLDCISIFTQGQLDDILNALSNISQFPMLITSFGVETQEFTKEMEAATKGMAEWKNFGKKFKEEANKMFVDCWDDFNATEFFGFDPSSGAGWTQAAGSFVGQSLQASGSMEAITDVAEKAQALTNKIKDMSTKINNAFKKNNESNKENSPKKQGEATQVDNAVVDVKSSGATVESAG